MPRMGTLASAATMTERPRGEISRYVTKNQQSGKISREAPESTHTQSRVDGKLNGFLLPNLSLARFVRRVIAALIMSLKLCGLKEKSRFVVKLLAFNSTSEST
jgi:hypothetical protein